MEKTINKGEIVLITGGSGCLGQHIVRVIQERDPHVKEIRIVDLVPYENHLENIEKKPVTNYVGDICKPDTIENAFENVDCVFHCAAYINFQYPPNLSQLQLVNEKGTKNIIDLCIKYNVPRLVFTSTSAVTLVPYMGRGTFCFIINQTESKAKTPTVDSGFLIGGYPASKLRAEKLVLASNGAPLSNGKDILKTIALRPPVIFYGEEDQHFFPNLLKIGEKFNGQIPRLAGAGGKHQMAYAGNIAWAHVRAKDSLDLDDNKISGLPVFITDNTPIEDTFRFCQRISRSTNSFKLRPSWWSLPAFLTYFIAFLLEMFVKILNPLFGIKLQVSPRSITSYAASILMFNRLRASIYLDYEPIYNDEKSIINSAGWYEKWYDQNIKSKKNIKKKL